MHDEQSKVTWLSLDERPPPEPQGRQALLCWFLMDDDRHVRGRYLGAGECKLITDRKAAQQILPLTGVVSWRPFDEAQLEEYEDA